MPEPSGSKSSIDARLLELGISLPSPPTPLGSYIEASSAGNLLFISGTLPVVGGELFISGRLGENLTVNEGKAACRLASLNALAITKKHLGDFNRLHKLVKLTVIMATTDNFTEHAVIADGASDLFAQIFGKDFGHARLVYGVKSLPINAPVIVDTIFSTK